MRRGRLLILVAIILLLGVAAVFLLLQKIKLPGAGPSAAQGTALPVDRVQVVIAAQDITRGTKIPENGVILSPFPADAVVETMMTDKNLVVGRTARMDIPRGVPVTSNMLTEKAGDLVGTGSSAAMAIPPGYTAIAIPMTRLSGIAYALRAGDKVDVLVSLLMVDIDADFQSILPNETLILLDPTGKLVTGYSCQELQQTDKGLQCTNPAPPPFARVDSEKTTGTQLYVKPSEAQRPRLVTQRLVANATVLDVGTFALEGADKTAGVGAPVAAAQPAGAPPQSTPQAVVAPAAPDVVSLIVSPQDALALDWAVKSGVDIVMTLRGPNDTTATETTSVTLKYLVDNYNITVPSKLPYGLEPRLNNVISPVLPGDATPTPVKK